MDTQEERNLWEELRLLQPIIDKCDNFTFQIKNWFITIFVAVSGYAVVKTEANVLFLNLFVVFAFYLYEISYRTAHAAFLMRCREIEKLLRKEKEFADDSKAPNLEKYLYPVSQAQNQSKWFRFFRWFGIPKDRAREDEVAIHAVFKEGWYMMFQARVSFIYVGAFGVNFWRLY